MAVSEISDEELDAYLASPDCPQCGSEDVVCTDTSPDGLGGTIRSYRCNTCGYTWAESA